MNLLPASCPKYQPKDQVWARITNAKETVAEVNPMHWDTVNKRYRTAYRMVGQDWWKYEELLTPIKDRIPQTELDEQAQERARYIAQMRKIDPCYGRRGYW